MLTFLTLCLLAIVVLPFMGIALIGALVGGLVWIVMFPIRLLFRILLGVVGVGLGLLFMPFILALVVVALVVAAIAALAPLLPLAAVGLIGWAIYKAVTRRPAPAI